MFEQECCFELKFLNKSVALHPKCLNNTQKNSLAFHVHPKCLNKCLPSHPHFLKKVLLLWEGLNTNLSLCTKCLHKRSCFTPKCLRPTTPKFWAKVLLCTQNVWTNVPNIPCWYYSCSLSNSLAVHHKCLNNNIASHPKCLHKSLALHPKCLCQTFPNFWTKVLLHTQNVWTNVPQHSTLSILYYSCSLSNSLAVHHNYLNKSIASHPEFLNKCFPTFHTAH